MMLFLLNGFIFLKLQHTTIRVSTRKTMRAATTGIQTESERKEKPQIRIKMEHCYNQIVIKSLNYSFLKMFLLL